MAGRPETPPASAGRPPTGPLLNENQRRRVLASCQYIDKLLSDLDKVVASASSGSPFDRYVDDLTKAQKTLLRDYSESIRAQMLRVLKSQAAMPSASPGSARHAIRSGLNFIEIALEELKPQYMRGYGHMPVEAEPQLNGLVHELQALVHKLDATLAERSTIDLGARVAAITRPGRAVEQLRILERAISRHGLTEGRTALEAILEGYEDRAAQPRAAQDDAAWKAHLRVHLDDWLDRKSEALRASVEAALRARLTRLGASAESRDVDAIEAALRKAAGAFEDVRLVCETVRDPSKRVVFEALELAAERATKALDLPASHAGGVSKAVRDAVTEVGVERADDIRRPLGTLMGKLRATLGETALALGMPEPATADEWAQLLREMPAFAFEERPIDANVFLRKVFGSRAGHVRMRKAIDAQAGDRITEALNAHGVALHAWAQRALARVQQQFDAQAEMYRAQLSQPMGRAASDTAADIERALAELAGLGSP
jgi:hypothetical protein